MALQSLQESQQCNSSEVHANKENNAESEFDSNSQTEDLKIQIEILKEKYFHLETNHEFLKDKFETVISSSVPAIQCEEILEQSKNLLETNQKLNKLNAGLLKVVKSGNFGKEGARGKVSKEAHKALNDLQKLSDELNIETKNSAKNLNRVEDFGKLNKKQLEEISVLLGCVDGHMGKAYESEDKLRREKIQHKIEIDKLNGEILRLQNNLNAEKEKLEQIIQHCYHENSELKKDNGKINNLTQQLKLKEANLIEAQEKNEKLQKEMKNLEGTLVLAHKRDETLAQLQSRCHDLQQQTQDQLYLNQAFEGRNSKCEQQINFLYEQLKLKEADVIEAREKNEKLQEEMKKLEGILASERRQDETLAKLESRYDDLQQHDQDQLKRNQVLDEGHILVQHSQIRRLQKDPLRIQNINLKEDLKRANADIIQLEEASEDTQQIKQMYITEIENPNQKLYQDQLKRNLDLECRISVLLSEIRELGKNQLQVQNEELTKNLKAANAKINKLTTKIQQSKPKPEIKSLMKKFDNAKTQYQRCEERNKNLEQELANLQLQQNLVSASKDSQMKNSSNLAGLRREVMVADELPYLRSGKRKAVQSSLEMEQPPQKKLKRRSTIVPPVVLQRTDNKTWAVTYTNMTLRQRKNVDQE